jgi:hypothetical protein
MVRYLSIDNKHPKIDFARKCSFKVFTKLLGLQFTIKYKKGTTNCVADALSRHPALEASLCAISQLQPAWLSDVIASYDSDQQAKEL